MTTSPERSLMNFKPVKNKICKIVQKPSLRQHPRALAHKNLKKSKSPLSPVPYRNPPINLKRLFSKVMDGSLSCPLRLR